MFIKAKIEGPSYERCMLRDSKYLKDGWFTCHDCSACVLVLGSPHYDEYDMPQCYQCWLQENDHDCKASPESGCAGCANPNE